MKLYFPGQTLVNEEIKKDTLTKLLYHKKLQHIDNYIKNIKLFALFNELTTGLVGNELKEIYVYEIDLKIPGIPIEFLKRMDNAIAFPVIFILKYKSLYNYIMPVYPSFEQEKIRPFKILYTGWTECYAKENDYNLLIKNYKTIDEIYDFFTCFICGVSGLVNNHYSCEKMVESYNNKSGRVFTKPLYVYSHLFFDFDIGSSTFESIREQFLTYYTKEFNQFRLSNGQNEYLACLGYDEVKYGCAGCRKIFEDLYCSMFYLCNIKKLDNRLKIEKLYKYDKSEMQFVRFSTRERSDEEVEELKLLYGKYFD